MSAQAIIDRARAALDDNPHRVNRCRLALSLAEAVHRRTRLVDVRERLLQAAKAIEHYLPDPGERIALHDLHDERYGLHDTVVAAANYRQSLADLTRATDKFEAEKRDAACEEFGKRRAA